VTISTTSSTTTLLGNGVVTDFDFDFTVPSVEALTVFYTDADGEQTTLLSSQYNVTLNAVAPGQLWSVGGTVTYPLAGSPIAEGTSLTITRSLPYTQPVSIQNQGNFYPLVVERALDRLEMQIQQANARSGQIRGTWASGVIYDYADIVQDGAAGDGTFNLYICAIANTSTTWSADLAAGYWSLAFNAEAFPNQVSSVSVATANGFSGSVANPTTTPQITLSTTITGILRGNGTAISAATSTGSGNVVLATSPTIITPTLTSATLSSPTMTTPTLGAATATSINFGGSTLSTYTQGTFTPTAVGSSGAGTGTYSVQRGEYTVIGNRTFFTIVLSWSAHTGTGNLRVAGLPSSVQEDAVLSVRYSGLTVGSGKQLTAVAQGGGTQIALFADDPAGGAEASVAMDTSVTLLEISGFYR